MKHSDNKRKKKWINLTSLPGFSGIYGREAVGLYDDIHKEKCWGILQGGD